MNPDPNEIIRALVDAWCENRRLRPLSVVLPAWLENNGLTDGWGELLKALKKVRKKCAADLDEKEAGVLDTAIEQVGGLRR